MSSEAQAVQPPVHVERMLAFCHERPYVPGAPIFESASGVHVVDSRGRSYLDGVSGVFVVSFGYSCKPIVEAVQRQVATMPFAPPLHGLNAMQVELCEALASMAGPPFDCVKLVNGGSESIEAALRMTRLYHRAKGRPNKTKVLSHFNGYHGATYGAMSATHRHDLNVYAPHLPGFLGMWAPEPESLPFGSDPEHCAEQCIAMVSRLIQAEGPESIGAILVEPIIHLMGMFMPPKVYFTRLRELCDRHDILLIFDEIVTGFGRTGQTFAAEMLGVQPDLICMGKSVSGGYAPLAAVVMSQKVSAVLRDPTTGLASFAPTHTYAGNPISAAAGLAAARVLTAPGFMENLRTLGQHLGRRLVESVGLQGQVRGTGMLWGVKLTPPPGMTREAFAALQPGRKVAQACMKLGVVLRGESDWLVVAPAYVASTRDLDQIAQAVRESIGALYREGGLA